MPWVTLLGFLRLTTNRASRQNAISMDLALEFVEGWLEWETVWVPEATARHYEVLATLLRATPRSRMVTDAHLAAVAIEHGLTLCSADRDFRVFPGLKFHNPLE